MIDLVLRRVGWCTLCLVLKEPGLPWFFDKLVVEKRARARVEQTGL